MEAAQKQTENLYKDNPLLRDKLIVEHLPLVKRIVYRISACLPPNVEVDDLISAGIIGLIQALERFDVSSGNKFTTYASFRIRGSVLSELRSRDFLSRSNRRKIRELERVYIRLEQKLGREPGEHEVAEELGMSLDQVRETKKIASMSFITLEEIGCSSKEERKKFMNALVNSATVDALTLTGLNEIKAAIARAIDQLPEKEKLVISLYYMEGLTMKEAGKVMDITESRISQIHSQAIIHLRTRIRKEGLLDVD